MKSRLRVGMLIVLAFTTAALGQRELVGEQQWKLVELNGVKVAEDSRAYIELSDGQTKFVGNSGCNRMFGKVAVQGNRMTFSAIGSTKMACADPVANRVEANFLRTLGRVDRFRVERNSLELLRRNRVVARLTAPVRRAPEDGGTRSGLEKSRWVLESIKTTPIGKTEQTAFLVFDKAKGSAGGNSSCNAFGGNYSASGSRLTISDVVSTMRACVEDGGMNVEREFFDSLRETNRYEIEKGRLLLYRNQHLLLTLRGERK